MHERAGSLTVDGMGRRWTNRTYLKVRKWVDDDLTEVRGRAISLFAPVYAGIGALVAAGLLGPVGIGVFWLLALPALIACEVFVLWRAVRLSRAFTILGDRDYDRRGKYLLPPEYANTESPLAAKRRKLRSR
ncbi:hypothetical protein ACO2Q1_14260 [Brevundimonas sp. VNH65]|uniref:hypothetical protein n=1 Tax=Brevundimonas sp. VNH65 TaxID=3400917 RepID=UPI003BFC0CF1